MRFAKSLDKFTNKEQTEVAKATKTNPKKFWAHIKIKQLHVLPLETIVQSKDKEVIITKDDEKASAFCEYISSVFTVEDSTNALLDIDDSHAPWSAIHFDKIEIHKALEKNLIFLSLSVLMESTLELYMRLEVLLQLILRKYLRPLCYS